MLCRVLYRGGDIMDHLPVAIYRFGGERRVDMSEGCGTQGVIRRDNQG